MFAHNADTKWTADRIEELTVLIVKENKSASQAADALTRNGFPVTRNAVCGKMHRLHIKSNRPSPPPRTRPPRQPAQPRIKKPILPTGEKIALEPVPEAPEPLRISLLDLTSVQCRWPIDEKNGSMVFCGHFAHNGRYCQFHHSHAHIPYQRRRA